MHAARHGEWSAWLASARAWLVELAEEGVERIEIAPEAAAPDPIPARDAAPAVATAGGSRPPALFEPAPAWSGEATLESVRAELGDCKRCRLCEERTQIVFGDGNPHAELMFVGEGPGAEEDRTGLPFVGRAGELLTAMIEKGLGIPRRDVYICNIVKCRPPGNRTPLADEARTCGVFLDGQIAAVQPKVIVALGKPATSLLLGRDVAITRVRGTWQSYKGIPLMPTLPPGVRAAPVHRGESARRVERPARRARARARERELVARRALRDRCRLRLAELGEAVANSVVVERENRGREQRRVLGAGLADRERGHRDATGHLNRREQRVEAAQLAAGQRNAEHGEDRVRGGDAGQVRRHAGASDDDLDAVRLGRGEEAREPLRSAVGRDHPRIARDSELVEHLLGSLHHVPVAGTAHDDRHARASFRHRCLLLGYARHCRCRDRNPIGLLRPDGEDGSCP